MKKKDLAYVLVKLSGFGWILLALFSSIPRIIELTPLAMWNGNLAAAARGLSWVSLVTAVAQIVLALLIINKADVIVDWLFGDDET